jgi:predicted methyltransferase
MTYFSLVEHAHEYLAEVIQPGDLAIDATMGNGHDTAFLAEAVGDAGKVLGFDVQPQALENTRRRLQQKELQHRVQLYLHSHANMVDYIPAHLRPRLKAVTFNLGYLPGSDKSVTTANPATLSALNSVLPLLAPGGVISVVAYRGHQGGEQETLAVLQWSSRADPSRYTVHIIKPPASSEKSPLLLTVKRRG